MNACGDCCSFQIDALNIEIDALLAKLAACQKSKGQSGIDCDKKLKDCQDGASKKLGVCKVMILSSANLKVL